MTPIKAIRKRCEDCQPDNRLDIKNCKSVDCYLYDYRNGKRPKIKKITSCKAIKKYCLWCMNSYKKEVTNCLSKECSLYLFRLGKNPNRKGVTIAKRKTKMMSLSDIF